MDTPVQNQPAVKNVGESSRLRNILWGFLGISLGVVFVSFIFLSLHYFNIISLSKIIPLLSFLPHRERMMQPEDKIAQVGKETLYGSDLLHKKALYRNLGNQTELKSTEQLKNAYMPILIQESITLQAGEKAGWIKMNKNAFNTLNKDRKQREKLLQTVSDEVNKQRNETTWDAVQVAFSGTFDESTATQKEQKKESALKKIKEVKAKIDTQKLSFEDIQNQIAKGTIATDSSSMRLYVETYAANDLGWGINITKETFEKIETMPTNVFSDVIEITMVNKFKHTKDLVAYAIAKRTVTNNNTWNDFRDWHSKAKPNYAITYY